MLSDGGHPAFQFGFLRSFQLLRMRTYQSRSMATSIPALESDRTDAEPMIRTRIKLVAKVTDVEAVPR
jgi:hypothetical protein